MPNPTPSAFGTFPKWDRSTVPFGEGWVGVTCPFINIGKSQSRSSVSSYKHLTPKGSNLSSR